MNTTNNNLSKYSISFGLSLALTSIINALIVIAKEKSQSVQSGMKSLTGHHWITHVAIVITLFFAVGLGLAMANNGQGIKLTAKNLIATLVSGVALGGLIIMGFYLFAD